VSYKTHLDIVAGLSFWLEKSRIPVSFFSRLRGVPNSTYADYLLRRKEMPQSEQLAADKTAEQLSRLLESSPISVSLQAKDADPIRKLLDELERGETIYTKGENMDGTEKIEVQAFVKEERKVWDSMTAATTEAEFAAAKIRLFRWMDAVKALPVEMQEAIRKSR
jgi:hypothetical protein